MIILILIGKISTFKLLSHTIAADFTNHNYLHVISFL
jgi:hypothetical protein